MKDHCLALPIHTFGGRGSQEATARPDDHRPVFAISENWDKSTLSEEEIPIKIEDPDVEIKHGISFIVFSKHYTIEHYLPARNLGYVVKDALPILEACFRAAMGISIKAGGVGAPSALYAASGIELATDYLHTEPMQGIIEQMTFKCDYDSCHQTQSKTFSQKEAYRDHLRDFHREDILGSRRVDDLWFETRDIQERWWRCKNCLSRVPISQDGYTCSTCYEPCEVERINARKARFEAEMPRIIVTESGTNLEWNKKFGVSRGVSDEDGSVSVLGKSPYTPPPTSWQKSSGSKSRRKLSSSKSYNGSKSRGLQPEAFEKVVESGFDLPAGTSFLFQVNQLEVNDDTTAGGVAPRVNENGNWIPPVFSNGFGAQTAGYLYRWNANGSVSRANDCQWYNGTFWMTATENSPSQQLTTYCTRTVFWCDPWAQFMFATGDASTRDMENSTHPHNHWRHLTFENDGPVSRIVESGENQYLAGSGSAWIADLGLTSHVHRHAPAAGGLSGSLAITLGIIAMSCPASSFDTMLVMDRAWRHHRWRGHRRGDGRSDHRGVVVHIYLDPANPTGSTFNTLHDLEAEGTPLIN
ncbi:hypothetical protein BKA64DRAFT_128083 [Cadophora sp. MPI-SDFR-AT-0126]|nr:hypothetical protein BKA64DRAFT_128083 [Leotiomycetes sp. MPI-SDFR-AT-0126]